MEDLDEGQYTLYLKSRIGDVEQSDPDSLEFEIDNIQSSSVRIYPLNQFVREGDSFEIYIFAENIQNGEIAGSQIKLHFDTSLLNYIEDTNNCGTDNNIFCPELNEGGMTIINWNLNGEFEGNIPLAHLTFNKIANVSADIIIYEESILRNSNNEDIQIDSFYNGRIKVGE